MSVLIIPGIVLPQPAHYGAGSTHIVPAWTLEKSGLYFNSYSDLFFTKENLKGAKASQTHSDVQVGGSLFYGFTHHLELGITQIFYQSNNIKGATANSPDDLFLTAKLGSLGKRGSSIRLGFQGTLRFASGNIHNIPLEPYASNRATLGLMGLVSIISDTLQPEMGINFHGNIGILTHNDLGGRLTDDLTDTIFVAKNTRELLYGFSFSYVTGRMAVFTEFNGRSFLQKPPVTAFGRESSLYVSPGISVKITNWLHLKTAVDLRLYGSADETVYNDDLIHPTKLVRAWKNAPNYPDWRVNIGITAVLRTPKSVLIPLSMSKGKQFGIQSGQNRDLVSELVIEKESTQEAETDLDRIRQERQQMEQLLKSLRNIIDGTPVTELDK
jgi:hypothetical protein